MSGRRHVEALGVCGVCDRVLERNALLVVRLQKTIRELHDRSHRASGAVEWWTCQEQVCQDARAAIEVPREARPEKPLPSLMFNR